MTNTISQTDSSSPTKAPRRKRLIIIIAVALVAVGLAILAYLFGPRLLGFQDNESAAGAPPGEGSQSVEFTEFRHEQTGIALSYPSSWLKLNTNDPQVLLLASDGPQNSFLLRAVELPNSVGPENMGDAKQLTDQIVGANPTARMLVESQQVELGGLPGYWYFYSFQDDASGQRGAHSHFFLFKDKTMFALVFQTVPLEKFQESAPTFDKITNSFRVLEK